MAIGVHPQDHGKLLASWRGVIVGTYLLMHRTAHWHFRLGTALASQSAGRVRVAGDCAVGNRAVSLLAGLALLGQLVGYNYFSGLFYSTAGSPDERRAHGGWHSRGDAGWRNGHQARWWAAYLDLWAAFACLMLWQRP